MEKADLPLHQEPERLQALYSYQILDTAPAENYDAFVTLGSSIFKTAIVYISFVDHDRLWFKSSIGIPVGEIKDQYTFCHHTITSDQILEVPDVYGHLKFRGIAAANQSDIQFYAGVPLITPQGHRIGTFCIADYAPRQLTQEERTLLSILGQKVMTQLEFDARNLELKNKKEVLSTSLRELADSQAEIDAIAYAVSHELKSPLRAIHNLAEWVAEELEDSPSKDVNRNLSLLRGRVQRLENLFNGLISYSKARKNVYPFENFQLETLVARLEAEFKTEHLHNIKVNTALPALWLEKDALYIVFHHLVQNSIRHNLPNEVQIEIGGALLSASEIEFYVQDNGVGIDPAFQEQVFGLFKSLPSTGKETHTGLGLTLVRKMLRRRKSTIQVASLQPSGVRFTFTWPFKRAETT